MLCLAGATGPMRRYYEAAQSDKRFKKASECLTKDKRILESFYSIGKDTIKALEENDYEFFLLDSGAFTFMANTSLSADFDEYTEKYAEFINKYDIKYFIEMDLDAVMDYKEVLRLRKKLEKLTGKQSIPVWHVERGIEEYKRTLEEYKYVAIGGLAIKDIKPSQYKYLPTMIDMAHEKGVKVHGLGFTPLKKTSLYPFDSTDSSAYASARFGAVYKFKHDHIETINYRKDHPNARINSYLAHINNTIEWKRYSDYAAKNIYPYPDF